MIISPGFFFALGLFIKVIPVNLKSKSSHIIKNKQMNKVISSNKIPENSLANNFFDRYDYCDSYKVKIDRELNVDEATTKIFAARSWVDYLMTIRNKIVKVFGLRTDVTLSIADYYPVGSKAVMFNVVERNENEILMGEQDSHLDFAVSVLLDKQIQGKFVNVTTIVKYNRPLGRIYFTFVKPFHRYIVKSSVKRFSLS